MPQIHLYRTLNSTNIIAREQFHSADHGEAWLADSQTDGHGRRETGGTHRKWYSPSECNIYLSVVVKRNIDTIKAPLLTLAVGALTTDILLKRFKDIPELWLKWPNDLYIGNKKLAGILTEGIFNSEGFQGAIVGIGVNVNMPNHIPDELKDLLTSLSSNLNGITIDRIPLALDIQEAIIKASNMLYDNEIDQILDMVEKYDKSKGRKVVVTYEKNELKGIAKRINDSGALEVEVEEDGSKKIIEVRSGEAKLIP